MDLYILSRCEMLATISKVVDGVAHAVRDIALGEKVLRQIVDEALGHIEGGLELLGRGRLARGPRIDRVHSRALFGETLLVLGDGLLGMGGAIVIRGAHHFPSNGSVAPCSVRRCSYSVMGCSGWAVRSSYVAHTTSHPMALNCGNEYSYSGRLSVRSVSMPPSAMSDRYPSRCSAVVTRSRAWRRLGWGVGKLMEMLESSPGAKIPARLAASPGMTSAF